MGPADAIALDNFFPGDSEVTLRRGFASHATGLGSSVETLMTYDGAGTAEMYGAAGTNIYEVTSAGAVGAAVVSSLTNARFQWTNIATSGGSFLWICNGADAPRHYSGSAWATPTLTGVTAADIVNVTLHKRRLMFCFNNSLKFGYLAVNTIAGAVSEFDLSSLFALGGTLTAIGTWTRDGGAGADDLAVFITSNGEVAVYSGTDPSDATKWALVGVFKIGRPIGRRPMEKVGADLVIITDAGAVPLSQVLQSGESAPTTTVTDKISGAFKDAADKHFSKFGWQVVLYPKGKYGLFNIPISTTPDFHQYVVNLTTGAWCRFKGQTAHCWVVFGGDLYFGGSGGVVYKADTGSNDNGAAILGYGKTAFNYFESRGIQKQFTMIRPVMKSDGDLPVSLGFDVDFADGTAVYSPSTVSSSGAEWDTAIWDDAEWAAPASVVQAWRSVQGIGYCGSIRVRTSTTNQTVDWHATDVIWIPGVGL